MPRRSSKDTRAALAKLFDPVFYLERHPEAKDDAGDPLEHFISIGAAIGCDPHPLFDHAWYEAQCPGLSRAGGNAVLHYLEVGGLGRSRRGGPAEAAGRPLSPHPLFDGAFYCASRPDVVHQGVNPLVHFLECGAAEGMPPNELFDAESYRRRNPSVGDEPLAPIFHLAARARGRAEGRAYHVDRRETAQQFTRAHRQRDRALPTTDAPCEHWERYAQVFAPTAALPVMADPFENPVAACLGGAPGALCLGDGAVLPGELRLECHSTPSVAVVVPVSLHLPNALACLRSLAAARTHAQFDVHVVVTDPTRSAHLKQIGEIPGANVVLVRDATSLASAMSRTALEIDRTWVAFLGCGTVVMDGWLDALLETFDAFPGAGLAASALLAPRALPSRSSPARDVLAAPFGAMLLRRDRLREIGGLPDRPLSGLGAALSERVRGAGLRVIDQAASTVVQFRDPDGLAMGAALAAQAIALPEEAPRRRALFVDVCTPTPGRDARSLRVFRIMELVREQGFDVTFVPANLDAPPPERQLARSHGFRVVARPDIRDVAAFASRPEERFDLCWVCRPRPAERLLEPLRRAQADARFVFDATDLLAEDALADVVRRLPPVDAVVHDASPSQAGEPGAEATSALSVSYGIPKVFAPVQHAFRRVERRDAFFVGGFQPAAALDGLLWFLDAMLPRVLERDPGFRVHVPLHDWSRVFTRTDPRHERIVLVEDRDLLSPWFVDRFRLVVAPLRFGPGVPGLLQMALARGVPCVATSVASGGLASDLRGPRLSIDRAEAFVEGIWSLHAEAWTEASDAAALASARAFPFGVAQSRVAALCEALRVPAAASPAPDTTDSA